MQNTIKNIAVIAITSIVLTSCYKGKYEDQLLLNDELTAKNATQGKTINSLQVGIAKANSSITDNLGQIADLQANIDTLDLNIEELVASGNVDNQKIDILQGLVDANTALAAELTQVNGNLIVSIEGLESKIAALQDNSEENVELISLLRSQLDDAIEKEAMLADALINANNTIGSLYDTIQGLRAQVLSLRIEVANAYSQSFSPNEVSLLGSNGFTTISGQGSFQKIINDAYINITKLGLTSFEATDEDGEYTQSFDTLQATINFALAYTSN